MTIRREKGTRAPQPTVPLVLIFVQVFEHRFGKNAIAACSIIYENVRYRTGQLTVLQNGATAHALHNAAGTCKQLRVGHVQHKGTRFLLAVCADALKLRIKQPHTLIVDCGGDLYGTCIHISARQHLYGLALVRCGEFAVKPKLRVLRQRAKALAARKIPTQAARPAAAAALADSYALMRRDLVARTVALALDAFCPTVSRLFSSTTLYGVLATSASDEATTAATTASARGTADAQEAPVITDVSEQTAFALEALLPGVQQCVDALRVLRVGGAALAEEFLSAVCTRVAATYVTGLTTRPAARTLAPAAVAQLCADADAVRAALAAFDAPLAARHLAPLADCCTCLRTGQVPPDSPLPPSVRSDLALLHILS